MAELKFTIPDEVADRVLDAFTGTFGWVDVETSGPKVAFTRGCLIKYMTDVTLGYEQAHAERCAREAVAPVEPIAGLS